MRIALMRRHSYDTLTTTESDQHITNSVFLNVKCFVDHNETYFVDIFSTRLKRTVIGGV